MIGGVLVATGAGLLACLLLMFLGRRLLFGPWRTWIGAGAGALLTSLVVGDFSVRGAGGWWARHPTAAATATGLLLLALTVLVVEAAVERVLASSEARRWRVAAGVAATTLLDNAVDPMWRAQGDLDSISLAGRIKRAVAEEWPPATVNTLRTRIPLFRVELHRAVLEAAPVLTATDDLHKLYDEVLVAVEALTDMDEAIREWYRIGAMQDAFKTEIPREDEFQRQFPETAQAWRSVMGLWATALSHLRAFEHEAVRSLGIKPPPTSPWECAPRSDPVSDAQAGA